MRDWRGNLDSFLSFNERDILDNAGHVSRIEADRKAREEYDLFHQRRLVQIEDEAPEKTIRYLEEPF